MTKKKKIKTRHFFTYLKRKRDNCHFGFEKKNQTIG